MADASKTDAPKNDEAEQETILHELSLSLVDGVGPRIYQLLREAFGDAKGALAASVAELLGVPGVGKKLAERIREARDLAAEAGCAVGAIYNVVDDLDELALAVNARTLAALEQELQTATEAKPRKAARGAEQAVDRLARMALAYVDFAAANTLRWRALFEHRLPPGKSLPDSYVSEQRRLFAYVEEALRDLRPDLPAGERELLARSLFSAVHGVVTLGLEEKLGVVPLAMLREQTTLVARAIGAGLARSAGAAGGRRM